MAPRRGGSIDFGGSSSSGSSWDDSDYSSGSTASSSACIQAGLPSWWNVSLITINAIFLVVYLVISVWHISFMVKARKIKDVPLLLRFRYGACMFCFVLSSFLETIFTGAYACSDMSVWDHISGMIPAYIFLNIAYLFLAFVALFPMSRAIRVSRKLLVTDEASKKSSRKKTEKTIQGILLTLMILTITAHLFISSINQGDIRTALTDGFTPDLIPGDRETYAAFPFLQLLANSILIAVSRSRISKLDIMDARVQKIKSQNLTFSFILTLRSLFMVIDTIVFDLILTFSLEGRFVMILFQKILDATLLIYIIIFAKTVQSLGDPNSRINTRITQGQGNMATPNLVAIAPSSGQVGGGVQQPPIMPVPVLYAHNGYSYPAEPQVQVQGQPQALPPGQWVFVPHSQAMQGGNQNT